MIEAACFICGDVWPYGKVHKNGAPCPCPVCAGEVSRNPHVQKHVDVKWSDVPGATPKSHVALRPETLE